MLSQNFPLGTVSCVVGAPCYSTQLLQPHPEKLLSSAAEFLTGLGAIHANGAKGGKVIAIPCIFSGTFYKEHLLDYFVSGQEDFYYMQLSS